MKREKDSAHCEDQAIRRDHHGWLLYSFSFPFFLLETFNITFKPIQYEAFTIRDMFMEFLIMLLVLSISTSSFVSLYKWKKGSLEDHLGSKRLVYNINKTIFVLGVANLVLLFLVLCTIYNLGESYEFYGIIYFTEEPLLINLLCSNLRKFAPELETNIASFEEQTLNFILYINPLIPVLAHLERYLIAFGSTLFIYLRLMERNS